MKKYYFPSEGISVEANSHAEAQEILEKGEPVKESGDKKEGGVSSKKKKKTSSPTDT